MSLALSSACNQEAPPPHDEPGIPPESPFFDDPACLPTDDPGRSPRHALSDAPSPPLWGAHTLGESVDAAQYGLSDDPGWHLDLIAGAPSAPIGADRTGLVRIVAADRTNGELLHPSGHAHQEIVAPAADAYQFGSAVAAANWHPSYAAPFEITNAIGQELLVGAPGSDSQRGRVYLYETRIDESDLPSAHDRDLWSWALTGSVSTSSAPGDRFGHSLAADRRGAPDDEVEWFAVGAPGANAVYIYSMPTGFYMPPATPVLVQTLTPSTLGAGFSAQDFGWSLVADDFDRDGYVDLAIGAPGTNQIPSKVFVVPGASSGSLPLDASNPTVIEHPVLDTRFGTALDGGNLFQKQQTGHDDGPRSLAIGAPNAQSGRGAVCWIAFEDMRDAPTDLIALTNPGAAGSDPSCVDWPFPPNNAAFGASVAIGNVSPVDPFLDETTVPARVHELIVGAPGTPPLEWTDVDGPPATEWSGGPSSDPASGAVVIFRGHEQEGPFVPHSTTVDRETRPLGERILRPDSNFGGAGFGSALRVLDVQRTDRPDLLVGAPGFQLGAGAFQFLNSAPFTGADSPNSGVFQAFYSDSSPILNDEEEPFMVRVVDAGDRVLVLGLQTLWVSIVQPDPENEGHFLVCELDDEPLAFPFDLRLSVPHTIGGGNTNFSIAMLGDGTLIDPATHSGDNGSAVRIDLTVSDSNFGDSDPYNDTMTLSLGPLLVWFCDAWRDPSVSLGPCVFGASPLDDDCTWQGAPFTLERSSSLEETCE